MANVKHVQLALQGPKTLNLWREANPDVTLDLAGANLRRGDFVHANLSGAILNGAQLEWTDFRWSDLIAADLSQAELSRSDFHKSDLAGALLRGADLSDANLEDANLRGAHFDQAVFAHTRLLNTDLTATRGLASTVHRAPSNLDFETLAKSGYLPSEFLKGCGLHDTAIRAVHSNDDQAIASSLENPGEFYSCFISHSTQDQAFVQRLYRDLQAGGVRCWYAPHHMRIGARILDSLFSEIRTREKLLLVLSKHSVTSEWVRDEVEKAFAEERDRKDTVVFPVRIDDAIMRTRTAWAEKIRIQRHIGDFRNWKKGRAYHNAIKKIFEDLRRSA